MLTLARLSVGDVGGKVAVPFHHVDLFVGQFGHDVLDAQTAHAHATAYRVHAFLRGHHGDLAAGARFAGDGLDFDHAVAHFGNFLLHEPAQQIAMGAAELDDRAARAAMDVHHVDLEIVAAAQLLVGNLLFAHQQRFGLVIQQDGHGVGGGVHAAHLRVDQLADAMGKILVDRVARGLADALQDDLLGRLRRNAAEVGRLGLHLDDVAQLHPCDQIAGIIQRYLRPLVEDVFHDFTLGEDTHVAGHPVNFGAHVGDRTVVAFVGRNQGSFNRFEDDLAVKSFVCRYLVDAGNECF
ncbi:MAG: hypothetical protein R2838_20340 [Caldilineaceae bacterium]